MREISLDTETTGLSFANGDRITEIGCVEIVDKKITGREFHLYINPERELSAQASEISGLTYDFLRNYKKFDEIADEFLDFVNDSRLVIHNAPFDIGFLNFELQRAGKKLIEPRNVVDTLVMAKEKFPGSPATLDALCRRFSVDASARTKHGALIDADLLAKVYLHMSVEMLQRNLFGELTGMVETVAEVAAPRVQVFVQRDFSPTQDEKDLHTEFLKKIKNPIWDRFTFSGFEQNEKSY